MALTGVFTAFCDLAAVNEHYLAVGFADDLRIAAVHDVVGEKSAEYSAFFDRFNDSPHTVDVISYNNYAAGNNYSQTVAAFSQCGYAAACLVFPEIGVETLYHSEAVVTIDSFEKNVIWW